jgi:glycosyltransferase involved in cell wall biosynthesis
MKKVSIVIPAYNEEQRIGATLEHYAQFFTALEQQNHLNYELLVVMNGCKDNTLGVVQKAAEKCPNISFIEIEKSGKGIAVISGFKDALTRPNTHIGFVDADGATKPDAFHDLICQIDPDHGVIASRYLPGSVVHPREKLSKVLGSRFFNMIIRLLFNMPFKDTQCGAKLFTATALTTVVPHMTSTQWAFDVDLLYGFQQQGFNVKEVPTVWADQKLSKLNVFVGGMGMLGNIIKLRLRHSSFGRFLNKK